MGSYKWTIIILLVFLMSCASVKTVIILPNEEIITVWSKKDALVKLKTAEYDLTTDNRGRPGWIEGLMQYILAKPEIKLSNKDGAQ